MTHSSRSMSLLFLGAVSASLGCDFVPGYLGATGNEDMGDATGKEDTGASTQTGIELEATGNEDTGSPADTGLEASSEPEDVDSDSSGPLTTTIATTIDGSDTDDVFAPCISLIDDLEDGDGSIVPREGRSGVWNTYNDGSIGAAQDPRSGSTVTPSPLGLPGGRLGARTSGQGFNSWGAGLGVSLASGQAYDASQYSGVSFRIRSLSGAPQVLRFNVVTTEPLPIAENGSCDPDSAALTCSDLFGTMIDVGVDLMDFSIPFADLVQGGWGDSFTFEPAHIHDLQWQVGPGASFDFTIDEVCFF